MSSHPKVTLKPFPQPGSKLPTYPHVIKCNSNLLAEVFTEQRDLGVSLTEVIKHDELRIHLHPGLNRLGGCAAEGTPVTHSLASTITPMGRARLLCIKGDITPTATRDAI